MDTGTVAPSERLKWATIMQKKVGLDGQINRQPAWQNLHSLVGSQLDY
jgi:hypothetical protein